MPVDRAAADPDVERIASNLDLIGVVVPLGQPGDDRHVSSPGSPQIPLPLSSESLWIVPSNEVRYMSVP